MVECRLAASYDGAAFPHDCRNFSLSKAISMSSDRYLFPHRLTRRDFVQFSSATAAALAVGTAVQAADEKPAAATPITIGSGKWTFALDENWGKLPQGMSFGHGCAIVVDGQDRIFVTSRSANPCVAIFDKSGKLLETWGDDFGKKIGYDTGKIAATAHGLYWSKEGDKEFFYFTENAGPGGIGKRVYKTDLEGKVLYELGNVIKEGDLAQKFSFDNPTDVAVAANGDVYVVDGYGSQKVHLFDKDFKHKKTIGGPGAEHGKFNVCHGIWVSTLNKEPEVYIADRANNRLEVYSLDLEYKRTIGDVRLPCCFYQHDGHLYVPELGARVTILDAADKAVAQLGDGAGIPAGEIQKHPDKFAHPHALTLDSAGNLYILEWLPYGRVRKFSKVTA
jgi:peptidylamidoglycolate lyase